MSAIVKGLGGVALAAAVLYGMQRTTPGYGEITSPRQVAGKLGHRLEARAFAIDITKVQLARTVATKGAARDSTFTTSGVWVLVEGIAEARTESLTLLSAEWLGPNGVRYAMSQRLSSLPGMLPGQRLEPGGRCESRVLSRGGKPGPADDSAARPRSCRKPPGAV